MFCFGYCIVILFLSLFYVVCGPTTLKLVSPAKKTKFFFIGRWNREETCEIIKFENAIWESNFDTMGYVWMGRWKYRKHKIFLRFNGGHCFTYLNQPELPDYCRNNWWHKKLSLFLTKWWNKAWAIYPVSWWDICC